MWPKLFASVPSSLLLLRTLLLEHKLLSYPYPVHRQGYGTHKVWFSVCFPQKSAELDHPILRYCVYGIPRPTMLVLYTTRFAHLRRDLLGVYLEMLLVFVTDDEVLTFYPLFHCFNHLFLPLADELVLSLSVNMI